MPDETALSDLVVNDRYWLRWARDYVSGALAARQNASEKLTSAISWFWSVYTGLAIAAVAFSSKELTTLNILIVFAPTVFLVLAYISAIWAGIPLSIAFDPRSPDKIKLAYKEVLESKRS